MNLATTQKKGTVAPWPQDYIDVDPRTGQQMGLTPETYDVPLPPGILGPLEQRQKYKYRIGPSGESVQQYGQLGGQIGDLTEQYNQATQQSIESDPLRTMAPPGLEGNLAAARARLQGLPSAPHSQFQEYTPPPYPASPNRPRPNVTGVGAMLAGIGGLIAPRAAGNFGASLIEGARGQANQEYQDALRKHGEEIQQREDTIRYALSNLRGKERNKALNDLADYQNALQRGELEAPVLGLETEKEYGTGPYAAAQKKSDQMKANLVALAALRDSKIAKQSAMAQSMNEESARRVQAFDAQIRGLYGYYGRQASAEGGVQRAQIGADTQLGKFTGVNQKTNNPFFDANGDPVFSQSQAGQMNAKAHQTQADAAAANAATNKNKEDRLKQGGLTITQKRVLLQEKANGIWQQLKALGATSTGSKQMEARKGDANAQGKVKELWDAYHEAVRQRDSLLTGGDTGPAQVVPSIHEGQTATNGKTGERVIYKGGKWQPLK